MANYDYLSILSLNVLDCHFRHMTAKFRALLSMLSIWVGSSMVEQRPFKPLAVGSSPTRPTITFIK